jgi:hypothetical protein
VAIAASEVVRIALYFVTYVHVHSRAMAPLGVARVARTPALTPGCRAGRCVHVTLDNPCALSCVGHSSRSTTCAQWMHAVYGLSSGDGVAVWVRRVWG